MKTLWLHKNGRDRLLVFCNGWGMDGCPFLPLPAEACDVLMFYNYKDFNVDIDLPLVLESYTEAHLVSWSMGVWVGQHLFSQKAGQFKRKIALNGTLCPIDDLYGIPVATFSATLENFNVSTRLKFYHRMCRGHDTLSTFLSHQPERDIEDQRDELGHLLQQMDCIRSEASIYSDVVIAEKDFIQPTANQCRFWQQKKIHLVDGYHFLFYRWNSWDEVINDPGKLSTF
jgi:pimeloyl-[acyl-carrier protein] methyl ester esterase